MTEEQTTKETYTVLSTLRHSGETYERGAVVELELNEDQVAALTRGETPTVKVGEFRLADEEVQRENEPTQAEETVVSGDTAAKEIDEHGDDVEEDGAEL